MKGKGFLFLAEAGLSALLLITASFFLPLFSHKGGSEADVLSCSDVSGVLVKMRAFESQSALDLSLLRLSSVSGQCIAAKAGALSSGSCPPSQDRVAVSFPVWSDGKVQPATVSCSRM